MAAGSVSFRLIHDSAPPVHDTGERYVFGLQDTKGVIHAATPHPGDGVAFDFELRVKRGPDAARPVFLGPFASGPADDRFVYLSWKAADRPGFINRVKARLSAITWDRIREAQASGRRLTRDASGLRPHDARPGVWTLS